MDEKYTHEQLAIGHLLRRQEELHDLVLDKGNLSQLIALLEEEIDISNKIIEYRKTVSEYE